MAEFLDSFDVERTTLLTALGHVEEVWHRFQERSQLEVEGSDESDSMITSELGLVKNELNSTSFTIGIFGLIKRGKSTLINGLIGRQVSAMHVTPETAVPVYVSHGDIPRAVVHFADGSSREVPVEQSDKFTSQKANPNNEMGVTYVEQEVPVGFLRNGTRLIDTPGLDDAEADEVYTERTLQELDIVDAGVVLFLSPPTVSATEMKFLEQVVARDLKKTFLVCNMYPQHFHDTETRRAVLEYVGGRIVAASKKYDKVGEVRVYPVCALEAWNARETDDIDMWKKSGADRLLRDIENYLSGSAGQEVLIDAADRIAKAAEMAKAEVRVRQSLLEDPAQLATFRGQLDANITVLERRFDEVVASSMGQIDPLKQRIRQLILQPFSRAKAELEEIDTLDEVEAFAGKFKRRLEVNGELASRQFAEGFSHQVELMRADLQKQFQAVMTDIAPNLPEVSLSNSALLVTPDQMQALQQEESKGKKMTALGGAAGGALGGGSALLLAGAVTALGPIGLLGGALAGWKLSSVVSGQKSLDRARETMLQRLDEIAAELLADLDKQVEAAIGTVRTAVDRRRRAFAADLYQQFEIVQTISEDPARLESYRRDAERFVQAFDACASRARKAVSLPAAAA